MVLNVLHCSEGASHDASLLFGLLTPARFLVICCCRPCIMCLCPHNQKKTPFMRIAQQQMGPGFPNIPKRTQGVRRIIVPKHPLVDPWVSLGWVPASVTKCSLEASRTWMPPARPTSKGSAPLSHWQFCDRALFGMVSSRDPFKWLLVTSNDRGMKFGHIESPGI